MEKVAGSVSSLAKAGSIEIVMIDSRRLERECFVRSVESMQPNVCVRAFPGIEDWISELGQINNPVAILYNTLGRRISEKSVNDEIVSLERASRPIPIIVLSPFEDLSEMIAALDCGARGYIPASLGIEAMLTAVRLSAEGAVFMTAASALAMRSALHTPKASAHVEIQGEMGAVVENFTSRQAAVADRLRRGKPNKLIAYELNMCESTVKVHIRNIMKKLRVTNRTEAGYKLNVIVSDAERSSALEGHDATGADLCNERIETHVGESARASTS